MPNEGTHPEPTLIGPKVSSKHEPDYHRLRPFFGWNDTETIKKTLEHTTKYARFPEDTLLRKANKSPIPGINVYCRQEHVACDIVYSDVPAIYDGSTAAVIFLVPIPKLLMSMVSRQTDNLSIPYKITSSKRCTLKAPQ
jgi:hypothetical protein